MADIQGMLAVVIGLVVVLTLRDFSTQPTAVNGDNAEQQHMDAIKDRQKHVPKPNFNTPYAGPVLRFSFCYS